MQEIISTQNFELIRDAIGRVLTAELANQKALITAYNANPLNTVKKEVLNISVFKERYEPIDFNEGDCINIVYAESQIDAEQTSISDNFENKYMIEIYCNAKTTPTKQGLSTAAERVAKIGGILRAILKNQKYRYLDFNTRFIQHIKVQAITRTQPRERLEAENVVTGVVDLRIFAEETTELITGIMEGTLSTFVKLHETEKGFVYIND